jgi:hypothetical protein
MSRWRGGIEALEAESGRAEQRVEETVIERGPQRGIEQPLASGVAGWVVGGIFSREGKCLEMRASGQEAGQGSLSAQLDPLDHTPTHAHTRCVCVCV